MKYHIKKYRKNKNVINSAIAENLTFISPKKSLGQNFLKSTLALNKIIEAGEITKEDIILEIGPGNGALTKKLLEKASLVIAVEKDEDLIQILQKKFASEIKSGSFILVNEDILNFDISSVSRIVLDTKFDLESYKLKAISYKLIANIPYNITGAILKKFLTNNYQPSMMVLMVQYEVAKRIIGNKQNLTYSNSAIAEKKVGNQKKNKKKNKESVLSISIKAYGEPKIIMKVPARYFSPKPNVDSAVIKISDISRKIFTSPYPLLKGEGTEIKGGGNSSALDEEKFWEIVKAGFAHKRKILLSNLKTLNTRQDLVSIFKELKLGEKARAEDLQLSDWIYLSSNI